MTLICECGTESTHREANEALRLTLESPKEDAPGKLVVCAKCGKVIPIPPEIITAEAAARIAKQVNTIHAILLWGSVLFVAVNLILLIRWLMG